MHCTGAWDDPTPVADPDIFTDDFADEQRTEDYWVEAYATNNWSVADGVYGTKATDFTYTRLHVYKRDIDYTAKIRFNELTDSADAGVLARYNDTKAYIRVGYKGGQWYLRNSEGAEFNASQLFGDKKYNEWYKRPEAYCDKYFVDHVDSEWYGYLHYDNTVSNTLKGNIVKGPFHIPRLYMIMAVMDADGSIKKYAK